jgi:uncharacterized protein
MDANISVQDADRLDAIGAMGIMRVCAFSGARDRPLYDPHRSDSAYQHFFDKLLLLKDGMKTDMGRKVAAKRHIIMQQFVKLVDEECHLEDF